MFRNPVEAKDILIDALEINRLGRNTVFDGEKDGFMVKVMPVNRIANREDLNDIITNIDQQFLEEEKNKKIILDNSFRSVKTVILLHI